MEIELPDGTILDAPDGADPSVVAKGYMRQQRIKALTEKYQAESKNMATAGNSFGQNMLEGIGQGMVNLGRKAGNLVGAYSDEDYAAAKKLDAPLMETGGGKVGSFLGETALISLPTMGLGMGLQAAGRGVQGIHGLATAGRIAANPLTRGVAEGAAQGMVSSDPNNRAQGALIGGALGGAIPLAGSAIGKFATGMKRTKEAQTLLDQGVSLTPGQMNPKGVFNQIEEALQSAPFVGAPIKAARDDAVLGYNRAAVNRAVAPGAEKVASKTLSGMIEEADNGFGDAYNAIKGHTISMPSSFGKEIDDAVMDGGVFADDATRSSVSGFVKNKLTALGADFDSGDLMKVRSAIRSQKSEAFHAGKTEASNLFGAAERKLTKLLESGLPKDAVKALRATDAQYRKFATITKAAAKAGDRGSFTPNMHSQAIKSGVSERLFAMGGGDGRGLSSAAREVFDVKTPTTGARLGVLGAGAAGVLAEPTLGTAALGGVYGLAATKTGRKLAAGQTLSQKQLRELIEYMMKNQSSLRELTNQAAQRSLVESGVN